MTTETEKPIGWGRLRPWHYLVIERDWDKYDPAKDSEPEPYVSGEYDDLDRARRDAESAVIEDAGLWDNWEGAWVIEPAWVDEVPMLADGYARTDLRPAEVAG